jgi:glucoamylase
MLQLANGGGLHPARNIAGGDFLHLVRYGIRAANDPSFGFTPARCHCLT